MAKQAMNNTRLGVFVTVAMLVLIFSLYMIGKNTSIFGSNIMLKARFRNVNGLMKGNNVRFSGIQAGNVKQISIINDTLIEVSLLIREDAAQFIHKNSFVSIGSEGLMGNKIINIEPNPVPAPAVEEGDLLLPARDVSLDDMMATLDKTNMNVAVIAEELKETVHRINSSTLLRSLLDDTTLSDDIKNSLSNFRKASVRINNMSATLDAMIQYANNGDGTLGLLMKDSVSAGKLRDAIAQINNISHEINQASVQLNSAATTINTDLNDGKGIGHAILKDSVMANQLRNSMSNIEKGTSSFDEDMKALQSNFLFRRYFRKQGKK